MIELTILFRTLNLYIHHAHNLTKGQTFHEDHAFFASLYEFADDAYDSFFERKIGTVSDDIDLCEIIKESYDLLEKMDKRYYENALVLLDEGTNMIDEMSKDAKLSSGTVNLLQGLSDQMEVFIYKIKRKLA
jgi:hypothetical protein